MAKVVCVLFPDLVRGYPPAYVRNDIPVLTHYPGGMTTPTPKGLDFKPGELLGCVSGELGLRKYLEGLGHTRFQPAARTAAEARHRVTRSPSPQSATMVETGWQEVAALSKTLENRADLRLAAKLPPHPCPSRPHPEPLSRLLPRRLLDDHSQVFVKPVLIFTQKRLSSRCAPCPVFACQVYLPSLRK